MRVAELTWSPSTGLPHVEVDDRGGWVLHVQGKGGKQRRIPLPKRLVEVLQGYRVTRGLSAIPARALAAFRYHVIELWRRVLRRRSQRDRMTKVRMARLANAWLPSPRTLHPWSSDRFAVSYSSRSRMRESCTNGSVRAVSGNGHLYRKPQWSDDPGGVQSERVGSIRISIQGSGVSAHAAVGGDVA